MTPSTSPYRTPASTFNAIRHSAVWRLLLLAGLVLCLQLPIHMISETISARQTLRDDAIKEISSKWGREQVVQGPILTVPIRRHSLVADAQGKQTPVETTEVVRFLPDRLEVDGDLAGEVRYRGIFNVPVYRAQLQLKASFGAPNFTPWQIQPNDVLWDRAYLSMRTTDPRAIGNSVMLEREGGSLPFQPSAGEYNDGGGIHVPLSERTARELGPVTISLQLRGSGSLALAPVGGTTDVQLRSSWPHPSFDGEWLPVSRSVSSHGFSARWTIPSIGRDYPQSWIGMQFESALNAARLGVALLSPIDPYRMNERSQKYQMLFISLTFLTLWLFEVLSGFRIHSIQYLLVGSALCLFYLLELALSEHLGFHIAYAIASAAVVSMITLYTAVILKRRSRSLALGGIVCALYGYLYAVLRSESYALLAGAVALFIALATIMYLTRRTDWYQLGRRDSSERDAMTKP